MRAHSLIAISQGRRVWSISGGRVFPLWCPASPTSNPHVGNSIPPWPPLKRSASGRDLALLAPQAAQQLTDAKAYCHQQREDRGRSRSQHAVLVLQDVFAVASVEAVEGPDNRRQPHQLLL